MQVFLQRVFAQVVSSLPSLLPCAELTSAAPTAGPSLHRNAHRNSHFLLDSCLPSYPSSRPFIYQLTHRRSQRPRVLPHGLTARCHRSDPHITHRRDLRRVRKRPECSGKCCVIISRRSSWSWRSRGRGSQYDARLGDGRAVRSLHGGDKISREGREELDRAVRGQAVEVH